MPDTVQPPARGRHHAYSRAFDVVRPYDVLRARHQARAGRPERLFGILRHFRHLDDVIISAMQSITSAVAQEEATFKLADESDEAARQRDFYRRLFEDVDMPGIIEDLMEGHYYGARAMLPTWDAYGFEGTSYQAPVRFEQVPMSWIYADKPGGSDIRRLWVGDRPYDDLAPGSVLLYTATRLPTREHVSFEHMGRGLAACRMGVFTWFNWEDWAAFNEAFGTPAVVGTLLAGWSNEDKDLLEAAVKGFTSDMRAIQTEKGEIELIERKGSESGFDRLRSAADRAKSRLIKSESLTDNMGERGSYAAMQTTNGIRIDVAASLATNVARIVNQQIVHPIDDLNFGGRRLVKVAIEPQAIKDLLTEVRIDRELNKMVPLSSAELYARYGRTPPDGDDDTVPVGGLNNATGALPFGGA